HQLFCTHSETNQRLRGEADYQGVCSGQQSRHSWLGHRGQKMHVVESCSTSVLFELRLFRTLADQYERCRRTNQFPGRLENYAEVVEQPVCAGIDDHESAACPLAMQDLGVSDGERHPMLQLPVFEHYTIWHVVKFLRCHPSRLQMLRC